MKNKLILLIILCISAVFMLSACGGDNKVDTEDGECVHAYTVVQTRMPTCLETGLSLHSCPPINLFQILIQKPEYGGFEFFENCFT